MRESEREDRLRNIEKREKIERVREKDSEREREREKEREREREKESVWEKVRGKIDREI